jgi:acetolactate synthase-like protein
VTGGEIVAEVLAQHGVPALFTLCGGHISPILVACRRRGLRVIDTRDEASAVFAADALSRLTGIPGVAAVTAGPGVTNSMTALTNARLAQSPLVLLGGATAGILKGRGALQDIDQLALVRSEVRWSGSAKRVRDIAPLLATAFARAREGGPVFLELPVDLLYDEKVVREQFARAGGGWLERWYMRRYVKRIFGAPASRRLDRRRPAAGRRDGAHPAAETAARPVIIVGSKAARPDVAQALERIGAPVYLSGMARGLLGPNHPLHMRHRRKEALKKADLVILAGVPIDFRLNYGRDFGRDTKRISVQDNPAEYLKSLPPMPSPEWAATLRKNDEEREAEIRVQAAETTEHINPLALCQAIDRALAEKSIVVADGGDFVSTASYIVRPRAPLSWLDPGPFGTLGVGAGFALGAAVARPGEELWILYGDGALGFTLAEFDTFARHRIPLIAVVANDACWSQIHREQVEILGDDAGCILARTDYHRAAEALGGRGLLLRDPAEMDATLQEAKRLAAAGHAVLVNAWVGRTAFRKGSISM